MVNYYAKFMPSLATMLSPIYGLLKKDCSFVWSKDCENSFKKVNKEIASDKNLVHYNPNLKLKLVCDASDVGIGAVLVHIFPN